MKDMTTTMSKVLSLGVLLVDVITMSTMNSAVSIKRPDVGHLSAGAGAEVAVLRLDEGQFGYQDAYAARFMGKIGLRTSQLGRSYIVQETIRALRFRAAKRKQAGWSA
jgi:predicted amidohydrolase